MAAMSDRGGDGERSHIDADAGLALGLTSRRLFVPAGEPSRDTWDNANGLIVALDGTIHDCRLAREDGREAGSAAVSEAFLAGDFPGGLDGYYSAAIWDSSRRTLSLALDTLGSKPLYYYQSPGSGALIFASRLAALIEHPAVPREIDLLSVQVFLARGSIFAPYSIYSDVKKLLPGDVLSVDATGAVAKRVYNKQQAGPKLSGSPAELGAMLRAEITAAAARFSRGGQRVGVMLSRGVDSTVLLAALSEAKADCIAYTLVYDDGVAENEATLARQAAETFGIPHRTVTLATTSDSVFSRVFQQFDEPIEAKRGPTQFFLAQAAAEDGVYACLNGVSGENVYGGMDWRYFDETRLLCSSDMDAVDRMLSRTSQMSFDDQASTLAFPVDVAAVTDRILQPFNALIDIDDPYEKYNAALLLRIPTGRHGVPPLMVPPLFGGEQRQPFRDQRLIDFGRRLPFEEKEGNSFDSSRRLVRAAYADVLPFLLEPAEKQGIPAFPWKAPGFDGMEQRLAGSLGRLKETGLVQPRAIDSILRKFYADRRSFRTINRAWGLYCLQTWYDTNVLRLDPFS